MPVPKIEIRATRSLLLPGPLPPLSHLGATLFRHSIHAALRYAVYQLGLPAFESPPIRFVSLRPYLDVPKLERCLGASPASREILLALVDPGGSARDRLPWRIRGTLWFHRLRFAALTPRVGRDRTRHRGDTAGSAKDLRIVLSGLLPSLGDALLGELLTVLERRQKRTSGKPGRWNDPVQSREARRFLDGARAALEMLGPPDPREPSWRHSTVPETPRGDLPASLARPTHRFRGDFRERYRSMLDRLQPDLLALGRSAVERGHLDSEDDIFFLPWELLDDLDNEVTPRWLAGAIASNRAEWNQIAERSPPADVLGNVDPAPRLEIPGALAPLTPLV